MDKLVGKQKELDANNDGQISGQDFKLLRKQKQEGGPMEKEMDELMPTADKDMVPDEEMEDNYMDFIIKEALTEEEEDMLLNKLQEDNELMMLFDKVIDCLLYTSPSPRD